MADNHQIPQLNSQQVIQKLLKRLKLIRGGYFFVTTLLFTTCLLILLNPLVSDLWLKVTLAFLTFVVANTYFLNSKKYLAISVGNLLEDINRQFPKYQESAQLLDDAYQKSFFENAEKTNPLSDLQVLQKEKIEQLFLGDYRQGLLSKVGSKIDLKPLIFLSLLTILLSIAGNRMDSFYSMFHADIVDRGQEEKEAHNLYSENTLPFLTDINIKIIPPTYTLLPPWKKQSLDLEVPEGSQIFWSLGFSAPELDYYYQRSEQSKIAFTKNKDQFDVFDQVRQTSLYRLSYQYKQQTINMEGVYSIAILRDQAPKIKILHPIQTLVEIDKQDKPEFMLEASISDDYGLSDIKILASVAKGSGEAVKFRDKVFKFSQSELIKNSVSNKQMNATRKSYRKKWSLLDLDMEPGDEVYLNIVAIDNKQPEQQSTKSSSIIVRWLDEQEIEIAAEGLKILFVPEYFRSQRQIIIETELLIADSRDLSRSIFEETSTDLGNSQSDLKQKYGQYLGDEIGEGPGEQFGLADGYHGGETDDAGLAHEQISDNEHDPEQHELDSEQKDLSGASQLIHQFTHNHGTTEVGPLSNQDPKSWMKMAVNVMWQAELHLMLSEPEKALPFEYKAYNYLKKAQQAERIYAKRLGFEPPPVTEERRLTGELQAILNSDLSLVDQRDTTSDNELFSSAYQTIQQKISNPKQASLTDEQIAIFSNLSARLLALADSRPVLVKYASIAQQIVSTKSVSLNQCTQCVSQLQNKLWQLLPVPISLPVNQDKPFNLSEALETGYLKEKKDLGKKND